MLPFSSQGRLPPAPAEAAVLRLPRPAVLGVQGAADALVGRTRPLCLLQARAPLLHRLLLLQEGGRGRAEEPPRAIETW